MSNASRPKYRVGHPAYAGSNAPKYCNSLREVEKELNLRGVTRVRARELLTLLRMKHEAYGAQHKTVSAWTTGQDFGPVEVFFLPRLKPYSTCRNSDNQSKEPS